MKSKVCALLFVLAIALSCAVPASAQIQNGDFESGGANWAVDPVPEGWSVEFPATGGNPDGHALIRAAANSSPDGVVCIRQQFTCGTTTDVCSCVMRYQVVLATSAADLYSASLRIEVDGRAEHGGWGIDYLGNWHLWTFVLPCGTHEIGFCLQTYGVSRGWTARFDNVSADGQVGVVTATPTSWGRLKVHYR